MSKSAILPISILPISILPIPILPICRAVRLAVTGFSFKLLY